MRELEKYRRQRERGREGLKVGDESWFRFPRLTRRLYQHRHNRNTRIFIELANLPKLTGIDDECAGHINKGRCQRATTQHWMRVDEIAKGTLVPTQGVAPRENSRYCSHPSLLRTSFAVFFEGGARGERKRGTRRRKRRSPHESRR